MKQTIVSEILTLFYTNGGSMYGGEDVTQLEHALQAATLARENNASDALVTAALLHDIGHLLHDLPDDASDNGIDDVHEALAAKYLETYFVPAVVEPVNYTWLLKDIYVQWISITMIHYLLLLKQV